MSLAGANRAPFAGSVRVAMLGEGLEAAPRIPTVTNNQHEHASHLPASAWIAALYDEVYAIAQGCLRGERDEHTLNPTALINEAYLRLAEHRKGFASDDDFRAAAATTMRRVLVDHARTRKRLKRGGGKGALPLLEDHAPPVSADIAQYLAVSEAIQQLETQHPRVAQVADMRIFGCMEVQAIARHLGVSSRTVDEDWRRIRAWLAAALRD